MGLFDFIIAGLLILFIGVGALRGLWRESLSLINWAVAILCGWLFADAVGTWFDALKDDDTRRLIAFLAIVLVTLAASTLLLFVLRLLLPRPVPNTQSRIFGALLGMARGAVVIAVLVLLAGLTSLPRQENWRNSALVQVFTPMAKQMLEWLPSAVASQFRYS